MSFAISYRKLTIAFFALFLGAGLFSFRDYGINWDDGSSRLNGSTNWNYIFHDSPKLFESHEKYHGPALEIVLVGVEKLFGLSDTRDMLLAHHLADFLFFFVAALAFVATAKRLFGDEKWALLAAAMLVLSPRILGDAFFNSKDIGFLCAFVLAFYTLLLVIERASVPRLVVHSLASAFAIDIRILGIILVPVTVMMLVKGWRENAAAGKRYLLLLALYPLSVAGFVIAMWPILWRAPVSQFAQALNEMRSFPWINHVLYAGRPVLSSELPWHYLPLWILITTPVLISVCWLAGAGFLLKRLIANPARFVSEQLIWGVIGYCCIAPIVAVIVLHSIVYDAWRHVFFIYPFFVLIAVYGLREVVSRLPVRHAQAVLGATAIYLAMLAAVDVYLHPYEDTYFNAAALVYFNPIQSEFETDYWGLSYKQGLEYILAANPGRNGIRVRAQDAPGRYNQAALEKAERARLQFVDSLAPADYFITNHRWEFTPPPPPDRIVFEAKRFSVPIITVYRLDTGFTK